jgi:hypothetical protein
MFHHVLRGRRPGTEGAASIRGLWSRTAQALVGLALLAGVVGLVGVGLVGWRFDTPFAHLARDVTSVAGVPWYTGLLSTLTLLAWAAALALTAAAAWLMRQERRRLTVLAAFLLVVMLDDALMLHEGLGPENGVPQWLFLAIYAVAGLSVAWLFLQPPWTDATVGFVLGGLFLGLSLGVDILFGEVYLVEDGSKFLGALVWTTVPLLYLRQTTAVPSR